MVDLSIIRTNNTPKKTEKNTFFHLIMLFLRSRRKFDGVWRFSYQSIGPKCGEPRTKGKLSPQSSSKTGGESSSPCLPSVSNHSLTESTSVWTKLAGRSQLCTKLSAFEIPQCCKKCNVWGVSSTLGMKCGRRLRLMPNKQPNQRRNVIKCALGCPCRCTLLHWASSFSACTSFISEKAFLGPCHHRVSGFTQEGL